jgi:Zn-dependent peptidase ImmA (M78 family)
MKKEKPKISSERAKTIEDLADAVRESHGNGNLDLHRILKAEDCTYSYGDYDDEFDGLIEWKNRRFHVYSNTARGNVPGSSRARFTLAHELGHYFIDEHRRLLKAGKIRLPLSGQESSTADLIIEQEANLFASCLLMPKEDFRRAAQRAPEGVAGLLNLADQFKVSALCAAIRAVLLETSPIVISFWTEEGLRWSWVSWTWFAAGFRKMKDNLPSVGGDFGLVKALADAPEKATIHRNGGVAAFWFHAHTMGAHEDLAIMEESIRLGKFGVLSVFRPADPAHLGTLKELAQEHIDGEWTGHF